MGATYSQMFPPRAALTEENLESQKGKVFIVTGGYSGVGYHLSASLFRAGAKVYVAGRSEAKAKRCIEELKSSATDPLSAGELEYLHLELDDLTSIKATVEAFKSKESKLDVLWNNAGVSQPPPDSKTKQGYELQIGTNCLGPWLLTEMLLPSLQAAAQASPAGSVRVVWTSSLTVDLGAPKGAMNMQAATSPGKDPTQNYITSKTGNWFMASELAKRVGPDGILSVTQNPGNLRTALLRDAKPWMRAVAAPLLYDAKFGAYTELWAGLSSDLTLESNGGYVVPWGRMHPAPRKDLLDALEPTSKAGRSVAAEFCEWCEQQTSMYR